MQLQFRYEEIAVDGENTLFLNTCPHIDSPILPLLTYPFTIFPHQDNRFKNAPAAAPLSANGSSTYVGV